MSEDERLDAMIRDGARALDQPPPTPREELWARIQAARALPRPAAPTRMPVRWIGWAVGLAATLALGVAIGRVTKGPVEPVQAPGVAVVDAPDGPEGLEAASVTYRLATTEHLSRVETFLSVFGAESQAGRVSGSDFEVPARALLRRTRLLRGSPAAQDDVVLRALLDDVEFVLLQIASYAQYGDNRELEFVERGINERSVLLRLRTAVPSTPERAVARGAL